MARNARRDALAALDVLINLGTAAFANVAHGALERPKDPELASLLHQTAVDLDRLLRLREALARAR